MGKKLYGIQNSNGQWMRDYQGHIMYCRHRRVAVALARAMGVDYNNIPFSAAQIDRNGKPIKLGVDDSGIYRAIESVFKVKVDR